MLFPQTGRSGLKRSTVSPLKDYFSKQFKTKTCKDDEPDKKSPSISMMELRD